MTSEMIPEAVLAEIERDVARYREARLNKARRVYSGPAKPRKYLPRDLGLALTIAKRLIADEAPEAIARERSYKSTDRFICRLKDVLEGLRPGRFPLVDSGWHAAYMRRRSLPLIDCLTEYVKLIETQPDGRNPRA